MRGTKFNKKIIVKRPVYKQDEAGELTRSSLETLFEVWARVEPAAGVKRIELLRHSFSDPKTVTLRTRSDYVIRSTDLVYYKDEEYQIADVYETEDEFYTKIDIVK